jgi:hypothetical protein
MRPRAARTHLKSECISPKTLYFLISHVDRNDVLGGKYFCGFGDCDAVFISLVNALLKKIEQFVSIQDRKTTNRKFGLVNIFPKIWIIFLLIWI